MTEKAANGATGTPLRQKMIDQMCNERSRYAELGA